MPRSEFIDTHVVAIDTTTSRIFPASAVPSVATSCANFKDRQQK
jgi:hypothetical protein